MSIEKNHHYLSQFYLKGFMDDKTKLCHFWHIKSDPDGKKIKSQIPEKVGFEKHLYSMTDLNGTHDVSLEKEFAKLESDFAPLFFKIIKGVNNYIKNNTGLYLLGRSERLLLAEFIRFQLRRTIILQSDFHNATSDSAFKIISDIYKTDININIRQKIKTIENNSNFIKNAKVETIKNIFNNEGPNGKIFIESLLNKNWLIVYISDKNKSFITSDYPVYRYGEENGIAIPSTDIITPISKNILLHITGTGDEIKYVNMVYPDYIKLVNSMFLVNADNLVVASNIKLLRKMIEWKIKGNTKFKPIKNRII